MSINLFDPHVRSHRVISFGKQEDLPKYSDPIHDYIDVNGWTIYRDIDQYGKITFTASKGLIQIKLETKEKTALPIKAVKDCISRPWEQPKFIEIPDQANKISASLEPDRYIERHYREASVLTPGEYLDSLVSEFCEIAKIPELNKLVAKVSK